MPSWTGYLYFTKKCTHPHILFRRARTLGQSLLVVAGFALAFIKEGVVTTMDCLIAALIVRTLMLIEVQMATMKVTTQSPWSVLARYDLREKGA